MGKEVFNALFSADNPFRRKPEPQLHQSSHLEGSKEVTEASPKKRKKPISPDVQKKPKKEKENLSKKRKRNEQEKKDLDVHEEEPGVVGVGQKRKGMDEELEMKVGDYFDDESKLLRTIFVGNLPLMTKRKTLMKEFGAFGEIESIRLRSVPLLDVCSSLQKV